MYSEVDNRKGVVRSNWKNVRSRVNAVNPEFSALIDEISPDNLPLYLVYLPYGQLQGDTKTPFLTDCDHKVYRLNSPDLPKRITDEIGYGVKSVPFGIVLEKCIEYYIDLPNLHLTLPRYVRRPGSIFPSTLIFRQLGRRNYAPCGILNTMSGCRSVFMLPNIGSKSHYERLQYDYNLKSPRPEKLYEHFNIFKELSYGQHVKNPWYSCVIYFSQKWIDYILHDPAWYKVKMYMIDEGLNFFKPEAHKDLLNFVFSDIQTRRNLKPNPYIVDSAKHIIHTALGSAPGYSPANDEESLPVTAIEAPFIESYGMKKYFPTIIRPSQFIYEKDTHPVYYSMQYPSTHSFSPKSRTASSMLVDMRELSTILNIFLDELSKDSYYCKNTIYQKISNDLDISCIHNQEDKHQIIKQSNYILETDDRFNGNFQYSPKNEQRFASDGKFFRGCVSIKKNN